MNDSNKLFEKIFLATEAKKLITAKNTGQKPKELKLENLTKKERKKIRQKIKKEARRREKIENKQNEHYLNPVPDKIMQSIRRECLANPKNKKWVPREGRVQTVCKRFEIICEENKDAVVKRRLQLQPDSEMQDILMMCDRFNGRKLPINNMNNDWYETYEHGKTNGREIKPGQTVEIDR